MGDDLFERIESLTTSILKKGGTPFEQSAIGLLADCRYDIDTLNRQIAEKDAEIERLHDALAPFYCTCIKGSCQFHRYDGGFKTCPHHILRAAREEKNDGVR